MENKLKQFINLPTLNDGINGSPNYTHIYKKSGMKYEEWLKEGGPHVWEIVEEKDQYQVWYDTAYGKMAIFKGDTIIGAGKHEIVTDDIVAVDKEYYGTTKYIFL